VQLPRCSRTSKVGATPRMMAEKSSLAPGHVQSSSLLIKGTRAGWRLRCWRIVSYACLDLIGPGLDVVQVEV
jgi:hypothetical protein